MSDDRQQQVDAWLSAGGDASDHDGFETFTKAVDKLHPRKPPSNTPIAALKPVTTGRSMESPYPDSWRV